ncbi:Histidine kinase [Cohaesibacter sp. ES.047]|uniref:GAF domain-containing sensor histidine kinase n=1 Tax=Cohaesibacter sp. ES.047 TaxID=1798205 RepID=UPI000BBFFD0B|nr:GAF domain-containing protein [Cohaesibacter sp. ES.047]SNY91069.1 Histidine kinase [Cohaesibacter sp. ES.047]
MSRREIRELDHYLAISRAIAGELDFQKALNRIAGAVKSKLLDYNHLDVAVIVSDDKSKHFAVETGVETIWNRNGKERPNALAPVRQLLAGESALLVTGDAWEDPRFHFDGADDAPIFDANLRSRIHVPMVVHGGVIGVISFSSHERNAYNDEDARIAQNIADLIAPYFYALNMSDRAKSSERAEGAALGREKNLRIGAQNLTEAMEAERQRLGMELHDQTLADLSAIYRQISRIADDGVCTKSELVDLSNSISRCTNELRKIIENAKPGVLDLFGVTQAIEAQLTRSTQGAKRFIATSVLNQTGKLLDQAEYGLQLATFRIVQEAVTNAVKHSGCSAIEIAITQSDEEVNITVSNDGISPPDGWRRSSRGVDNMRVRASLIGATLDFERNPTSVGSRTILRIPRATISIAETSVPQPSEPRPEETV